MPAGMSRTSAGTNSGNATCVRYRISVTTTPPSTSRGGRNPPPPSAQLGPPSSVEPTVTPDLVRLVAVKRGREPATRLGNNPRWGASRVSTKDHSLATVRVGIIGAGAGGHRDGHPACRRRLRFHDLRPCRRLRRDLAAQHLPGCGLRCPIPSVLVLVRAQSRWSKTYANQPEILAYLEKVALDHGLARTCGPTRRSHRRAGRRRPALDPDGRRRPAARVRRRGERRRNARRAEHPRHPWGVPVPRPPIPFGPLGSQ